MSLAGLLLVGNTFTAAAVLALREDKKLGPEDPVGNFLPELPAWRT